MRNGREPVYPRRALVCVLGMSPQILTETLYGLATDMDPAWIPTEIHVITTRPGAELASRLLLGRPGGQFYKLLEHPLVRPHLPARGIQFDASAHHLHVIERDGRPLPDIDDPDDSTAAGNAIMNVVGPLVSDPRCQIHASIAGGRKTMGALLLSAISLLGRPQDKVSHVLVSSRFESHPKFFFPPHRPVRLQLKDGSHASTSEAGVRLALVPLLRFSAGLRGKILDAGRSYEELVAQAEEDLVPQPVFLSLAKRSIRVGRSEAVLEPLEMAWYAYLADRRRRGIQESGLVAPGMVRVEADPANNIGFDEVALRSIFRRFINLEYRSASPNPGEFKREFASRASYINRTLRTALGEAAAHRVMIMGPGARRRKDAQYGLSNLEPGLIRIQ